jgi:hypothetical protein
MIYRYAMTIAIDHERAIMMTFNDAHDHDAKAKAPASRIAGTALIDK